MGSGAPIPIVLASIIPDPARGIAPSPGRVTASSELGETWRNSGREKVHGASHGFLAGLGRKRAGKIGFPTEKRGWG